MPIGPIRKEYLAALRKQKQEKTAAHATPAQSFPMVFAQPLPPTQVSQFYVALALPLLPIPTQATTAAATVDAIAAAQAQELAVEVLTSFASIEEERAQAHAPERPSTPVDFNISAMVVEYYLDKGLSSGLGPSRP